MSVHCYLWAIIFDCRKYVVLCFSIKHFLIYIHQYITIAHMEIICVFFVSEIVDVNSQIYLAVQDQQSGSYYILQ